MNPPHPPANDGSPKARILVIEDELPMRTVLRDCLERHGYRVLAASDGAEGLDKALTEQPDLILLDIMMPKLDGFALCAELRRLARGTPILFVTAKGRVEDRVQGLDLGGDDYLVKPFSRDELLARVRALLRRAARRRMDTGQFSFGNIRVDFAARQVWRDGEPVALTAKEFDMLRLLVCSPGEVITRDRFLDAIWGYTAFPTTRTVDKHMAGLRAKLEGNPDQPRWLKTVHGTGYRFEPGACPSPAES